MDVTSLIDRYCDVWNEADPLSRGRMLSMVWKPGGTYSDPLVYAVGLDELLDYIASFRRKYVGGSIRRNSKVDMHHRTARFGWNVVLANGTAMPAGMDLADISEDASRIERVVGFFGPLQDKLKF